MKKLILFFIFIAFAGIQTISAQCTPVPFSGTSLTNPDTTQGLQPAVETQAYSQVIHVRIPEDTNYNGAVIPIDSAGIIGVTGMPASMSWLSNTASNYWPGDTFGCIIIQGTPGVGDAGNYILSIVVAVNALGTALPFTMSYDFVVLDASHVGIDVNKTSDFQIFQNQPNPFSQNTLINYYSPKSTEISFKVYDILGNCVVDKVKFAEKGKNSIELNRTNLANGIYIYELSNGESVLRKRMIIK
jgi:hypothetical protein